MAQSVIGALRVNLGLDSAQFQKGARDAQTSAQKLSSNLKKIGAAASAVGAGMALAIRGQLSAADQLGKSAQQLGLPVEALSQLQFAASQSGVAAANLETSLRRLSQNMAEDAEKFSALGVSVRDLNGEMRPTVDVMGDVADVLANMPDGAEKTALAMDLMGRSGAEMIPLLNAGADALREMMREADALGLTISGETAEAAAQFNDNLARISGLVRGIARIMAAEFAPILADVSDAIVSMTERFQGLSPQTRRFIGIIGGLTIALGPVLIALGLLVTAVAAISAPVLLVVGGITALTAALVALWPSIRETVDSLIDLGIRGVDFVKDKLRELVDFLADLPARFREAGANLMSGLTEGITSGAARARDAIGGVVSGLRDRFSRDAEIRSPSRLFARFGRFLMEGLGLGIRENARAPIGAMQDVASQLNGPLESASSDFVNSVQSGLEAIALQGRSVRDVIRGIIKDIASSAFRKGLSALFGGSSGGGGILGGITKAFSFEGGGFTGRGPRTGGLDGKGGFRAILHPNETVIDHTKMNGGQPARIEVLARVENGNIIQTVRQVAGDVAVQVMGEGLTQFERNTLPESVKRINADPRRRG